MAEPTRVVRKEIMEALDLVRARNYEGAEAVLRSGLEAVTDDPQELAVLFSTLGMIQIRQGKIDEAWASYEQAEQATPTDPVLKVIIARFLLTEAARYNEAMKRGKQILKAAQDVPSLKHQAHAIMGLAYFKKGNKKKAGEMLQKAMEDKFLGMATADNIDFNLVEALVRDDLELATCQTYVAAARDFARTKREFKAMAIFQKILDSFGATTTESGV